MTATQTPDSRTSTRKTRLMLAGGATVLAGAGWAAWTFLAGAASQTTDNAYVNGHIVAITPQVAGAVSAIWADNADRIAAGQTLVEVDPADIQIALAGARADLARARRRVQALFASRDQAAAEVTRRQAELDRAQADVAARRGIAAQGAITSEEARHAADALNAARAALAVAQAAERAAQAQIDGVTPDTHPDVALAQERLRAAALAAQRTTIRAPVGGMVAQRSVQLGKQVGIGDKLMSVVPLDQMWIDANFKEIQLAGICPGQPAVVTVDAHGAKVRYRGRVGDVMAGSGSAFALLPSQNATGNWIKVVQRVPVRINLDPKDLADHPLRIGLSAEVTVDTARCEATQAGAPNGETTDLYRQQRQAADALAQAGQGWQ
ncbi:MULTISPECIES: efflux RND transporter periplasmic adaptor subunit [Achromobacter]|jgi:membrane fusion protein (multidrug efflux system)|nr:MULTISPECIES: efflux RND transporter periplasmic adaptor subunit [Achromobacter]CUI86382.1 Inner membrane protein yibH [Achromobacter sp. 2789STDY5608628]CUJ34148.1 Inner membrane protein yibH [Achromobacter sp. 2789STDY5608633]